jgi:hypothetical protein
MAPSERPSGQGGEPHGRCAASRRRHTRARERRTPTPRRSSREALSGSDKRRPMPTPERPPRLFPPEGRRLRFRRPSLRRALRLKGPTEGLGWHPCRYPSAYPNPPRHLSWEAREGAPRERPSLPLISPCDALQAGDRRFDPGWLHRLTAALQGLFMCGGRHVVGARISSRRASARARRTSQRTTFAAPAIGMAASAPMTPANSVPITTATSTASGDSSTVRP